jgi:integrase
MRAVLVVKGKGSKTREVPISDTLAGHLDAWGRHVGTRGKIVRSLSRAATPVGERAIGASMSAVGLFQLVQRYGKGIGKPELAPHDLRRTYAQLGFEAGVPITQISRLLGHASIATTQAYLNLELDLAATASDFIPW